MTVQLVSVFNGLISNESVLLCDARDLHSFLEIGKDFSTWIRCRISEYEFIDNQDYILIHQSRGTKTGRGGDRRSKDYHLTLDTAKELAMVERNDKGRQVRRYFIECEKKLRSTPSALPQRFLVSCTSGEWKAQPIMQDEMVCNAATLQRWIEDRQFLDIQAISGLLMSCARRLAS